MLPEPVIVKVYGFSSESLFAIETVADLFPTLVGLNVIEKVVLLPNVIVESVELIFALNSEAFAPVSKTIGEPVKFKSAYPVFSIVKVIAELEAPTRTP